MTTPARSLGVTRYLIGSAAMTVRASICSETFMDESSAAMALPTRPVTIRAVKTGPNSLVMAVATVGPTMLSAENLEKPYII
jgi:hypothetical protein